MLSFKLCTTPATVTVSHNKNMTSSKTLLFTLMLYFTLCRVVVEIIHIYYNICYETEGKKPPVFMDLPTDERIKGLAVVTIIESMLPCLLAV